MTDRLEEVDTTLLRSGRSCSTVGTRISARFDQLFEALVGRWVDWRESPRDPDRVPELARARFALNDARSAIAAVRQRPVAPFDGSAARTAVSAEDRARLRVHGAGGQQN